MQLNSMIDRLPQEIKLQLFSHMELKVKEEDTLSELVPSLPAQ